MKKYRLELSCGKYGGEFYLYKRFWKLYVEMRTRANWYASAESLYNHIVWNVMEKGTRFNGTNVMMTINEVIIRDSSNKNGKFCSVIYFDSIDEFLNIIAEDLI